MQYVMFQRGNQMHLNNILEKVTILPWVGNSYLLLFGEWNGGIQHKAVYILSTKFSEWNILTKVKPESINKRCKDILSTTGHKIL